VDGDDVAKRDIIGNAAAVEHTQQPPFREPHASSRPTLPRSELGRTLFPLVFDADGLSASLFKLSGEQKIFKRLLIGPLSRAWAISVGQLRLPCGCRFFAANTSAKPSLTTGLLALRASSRIVPRPSTSIQAAPSACTYDKVPTARPSEA